MINIVFVLAGCDTVNDKRAAILHQDVPSYLYRVFSVELALFINPFQSIGFLLIEGRVNSLIRDFIELNLEDISLATLSKFGNNLKIC